MSDKTIKVDTDVLPSQGVRVPYSTVTPDLLMGRTRGPSAPVAPPVAAPPPAALSIADMKAPPRRASTFQEQARNAQAERMSPEDAELAQLAAEQKARNLMQSIPGLSFEEGLAMLGARVRVPASANPARPVAEGALSDAQEYIPRQRDAIAAGGEAQVEQETELSSLLARQELRNSLELAVEQDLRAKEADLEQQGVEAVERAHKAVHQATMRLRAQPDVDSNRLWKNASNRDRALFAIGGFLGRGIFGPLFGRFADLEAAIDDDIADQVAGIEKRKSEVAGAVDETHAADVAMRDILAATGSAQAAREGLKLARLEQQKADYMQQAMELGIPMTEAHVQQTLAEFDEAASRTMRGFELAVAKTPKMIGGGTRPLYNSAEQKAIADQMGLRGEMFKEGAQQQGRIDLERLKQEAKGDDDQLKLLRGEGGVYREAQQFAGKAGAYIDVVNQGRKLRAEFGDDAPGIGPFAGTEKLLRWRESGQFDAAVGQIEEAIGRARSQGAITEDEEKRFKESIKKGTFLGGETRFWDNLQAIEDAMNSRVDLDFRALSPEGQAYVTRNKMLPGQDPTHYGLPPEREVVTQK